MPRIATAFAPLVLLAIAQVVAEWLEVRVPLPWLIALLLVASLGPGALVLALLRTPRSGAPPSPRARASAERIVAIGPLAGFLLLLAAGWGETPERWIPPEAPGGAALATLLPYVAALALALLPGLRSESRQGRLGEPVGRALRRELRPVILLFSVYTGLRALSDLGWLVPGLRERVVGDPVLSLAGILLLVVAIAVISPFAVRWLHPARPLPAGPLRERLDRLAAGARVSLREVWVWDTGPRPSINACVSGIVPSHRSVFLTDGLLAHLDDVEIESVFAHELAHGTRHHLWIYTALVLGIAGLAVGGAEATHRAGVDPGAAGSLFLLLAVSVFFFRFFGVLSRHFESQADLESAERTGSPFGIVSALGKIGSLTGTMHRRGWRHPPIPERIATVLACTADERARGAFRRRTRRLLAVAGLVVLLGAGGWAGEVAGRLAAPPWERDLAHAAYLIAAERERAARPGADPVRGRRDLERAVGLVRRALPALGASPEPRAHAYLLLAEACSGLGDPASEAAARYLAGPRAGATWWPSRRPGP